MKLIEEQLKEKEEEVERSKTELDKEIKKTIKEIKNWKLAGYTSIGIGLIILVAPFIITTFPTSFWINDYEQFTFNEYGDFVGGVVSSIWSLAGLIFIYVAFIGQKQQVLIQQHELKHTQYDTLVTRSEMAAQIATQTLQQFENSFFTMLKNIIDHVNSIETYTYIDDDETEKRMVDLKGVESFKAYDEVIYNENGKVRDFDSAKQYYYYGNLLDRFETYHTNLSILLSYVDNSELSAKQKETYVNLVIMPMTFRQKKALTYHIALCRDLNPYDTKLKELERKHKFLENIYKLDRIAQSFNYTILYEAKIYDNPNI